MIQDEVSKPIDLKRYLALLQRRRYIALSIGILVVSIFTWGSFILPKVYQASATVSIERSSVLNPLMQGVGVSNPMEDKLKNIKNELMSRHIIEKTLDKLGIQITDPRKIDAYIFNLQNKLDITIRGGDRGASMFQIAYKGNDPKMVADFVNTITRVYIDDYMHSRRTDTSEAYEFIDSQLLEYKQRLEESDKAIRNFKEKNPNLIPQSEGTLMSRIEKIKSSQMETDIRVKELMSKRENLRKQLSGEKELTLAFVTREGSPQARLDYLNNQLVILLSKYTENYPEVIKVKREIEELKKQIAQAKEGHGESVGTETASMNPVYQQLKEELSKTDAEIESLRGRNLELSRQQQEVQKVFSLMPKEQEEWTKLQRDRNVYQQIYDQLLQKLENARVSKDLENSDKGDIFQVVDPAIVPSLPVSPNRLKMILMGIFLGIASGLGAVFGLEYFDHSFKDEESVETTLKLPVLTAIPEIPDESDELRVRKFDRKIYIASAAYLSLIGIVLIEAFISRYLGYTIFHF